MHFLDAVRLAWDQWRTQRLRCVAMMAGVAVAVAFLIALVSIIAGTRANMEAAMVRFAGANTFNVTRYGRANGWSDWLKRQREHRPRLTETDALGVAAVLPANTRWAILQTNRMTLVSQRAHQPTDAAVDAIAGQYFEIMAPTLTAGRYFTPEEMALGANVIMLSAPSASMLFPELNAVGRTVVANSQPYEVVGVFKAAHDPWYMTGSQNSDTARAIMPMHSEAARGLGDESEWDWSGMGGTTLRVQVAQPDDLQVAQDRVREYLRIRHGLRPQADDDFTISTGEEYIQFIETQTRQIVIAGVLMPIIGVIVGAMVITNIMLVAVAERTREIGIRKAVGARRLDVRRQFLVEAVALSVVGSAIGVILGVSGPLAVQHFNAQFPAAVVPWSIAAGIALGVAVGVVSGVYPATRAARMDPIHALRHET